MPLRDPLCCDGPFKTTKQVTGAQDMFIMSLADGRMMLHFSHCCTYCLLSFFVCIYSTNRFAFVCKTGRSLWILNFKLCNKWIGHFRNVVSPHNLFFELLWRISWNSIFYHFRINCLKPIYWSSTSYRKKDAWPNFSVVFYETKQWKKFLYISYVRK